MACSSNVENSDHISFTKVSDKKSAGRRSHTQPKVHTSMQHREDGGSYLQRGNVSGKRLEQCNSGQECAGQTADNELD